ncbi:MAG TPA: hypothetical protein ENJ32_11275 [Crenotrichaceae bacterium]|nr:hypothetical protein [Crenotrichaceae bacterium]
MKESSTYIVAINGKIKPGFDLLQVQQAFAKQFSTSVEKASRFVGSKQILKKNVDIKTAHTVKRKLEDIGLVVVLKEQTQSSRTAPNLSLQPIEEKVDGNTTVANASDPVAEQDTFACPKCNLKQPKSAQCIGCGVFMHKLQHTSGVEKNHVKKDAEQLQQQESAVTFEAHTFNSKAFLVATVAAFLGALLWKIIAVKFNYELGLVAWIIGGAIGFGAALFGSKGHIAGVVCGILALFSILGGKYMATETFRSELVSTFTSSAELYDTEMKQAYEEELLAAKTFEYESSDEAYLRRFMLDYDYTDSSDVESISDEEIQFFRESIQPRLEMLELNPPEYEQWIEEGLQAGVKDISTLALMKEDVGVLDFVFLILGIGTAFRLGRGLD